MIGWNPENEDEIFNLNELIEKFDISRIIKSGAKYDFESKMVQCRTHKKYQIKTLLKNSKTM